MPMNNSGLSCSIRSNVFGSLIFYSCIVFRQDCSYEDPPPSHRFCIYSAIVLLVLLCFYSCDNHNPIRNLFPRRSIRNTSWDRQSFCTCIQHASSLLSWMQWGHAKFFTPGNLRLLQVQLSRCLCRRLPNPCFRKSFVAGRHWRYWWVWGWDWDLVDGQLRVSWRRSSSSLTYGSSSN